MSGPQVVDFLGRLFPSFAAMQPEARQQRAEALGRYVVQTWVAGPEGLRQRGIEARAGMEADSLEGILELVANGLGVAVLPRRNLAHPFPGNVKAVPFGEPAMTRTLGLLQRPDSPRADLLRQLVYELTELSG